MANRKRPTARRTRSIRRKTSPKAPVRFLIEALYDKKATSDTKARTRINKLFDPFNATEARKLQREYEFVSNLYQHFAYDPTKKVAKPYAAICPWTKQKGVLQLSRVAHSSLTLYRTLCLFPGAAVLSNKNEKSPFGIYLRHITTGYEVLIGEHNGVFRFYTTDMLFKECPKPFLRDLTHLVNLLLSERCPHPHEDLVAGFVA